MKHKRQRIHAFLTCAMLLFIIKIVIDSCLVNSIKCNDAKTVSRLLSLGADPNTKCSLFWSSPSALLVSIDWRARKTTGHIVTTGYIPADPAPENLEILHALLEKGASPYIVNEKGYTPLMIAAWQGKENTVVELLRYDKNINYISPDKENALTMAIYGGNHTIIHLLVKSGIETSAVLSKGYTALDLARVRNDQEAITILTSKRL